MSAPERLTPADLADPTILHGKDRDYRCDTLNHVDLHIRVLTRKIRLCSPDLPKLAAMWTEDRDSLLERRQYLALISE